MKKFVYGALMMLALAVTSCAGKTETVEATADSDSTVVETVDSTATDTVVEADTAVEVAE